MPPPKGVQEGLLPKEIGLLVLGSLLLTPLLGGALALHWQRERPLAGRQAWVVSLVLALFLGGIWVFLVFRG